MKIMKKILPIIFIATLISLLFPLSVSAADVGYEDFYFNYESSSGTYILVNYIGHDTEITIPSVVYNKKVTKISDRAFSNNANITKVYIPETITEIGSQAFSSCTSLVSIIIPESVVSLGDSIFYNCSSLKSATLRCNVSKLPDNTFNNCVSLKTVIMYSSFNEIGNNAFRGCTSLTNLPLYDSIKTIGQMSFYNTGVSNLKIPNVITTIPRYAFGNCTQLETVFIPQTVESINTSAFKNSNNVTINCYKNTTAHIFAVENNISYVILDPYPLGDVDLNDVIDVKDATLIQKYLASITTLDDTQFGLADYNGDGQVNIMDATAIQKYLVS